MRGRKKRDWVKIDCDGILRGSINWQLTLEEQMVWVKLIAYAEVSTGEPGFIQDNDRRALPHDFIAQELHCPLEVLESALTKCLAEGRVKENSSGIELVNFPIYQFCEYDRQRPYRMAKKAAEDPDKFIRGGRVCRTKKDLEKVEAERKRRGG